MARQSKGISRFPPEIRESLRSYVYVYTDPKTKRPFYVGKEKNNRAFSHLNQVDEHRKVEEIRRIRSVGREPIIEILRYGLTPSEACLVEAAAIDLLGLPALTNECRGMHSRSFGRISAQELRIMAGAKPARIRHRVVLIKINKLYRSGMSGLELYEATRGIWKVGRKREKAELAFSIYQGIIREVYRIDHWQRAGSSAYKTREFRTFKRSGRWEFVGRVAVDVRDEYLNKSVRHRFAKGSQNPVRYVNIK